MCRCYNYKRGGGPHWRHTGSGKVLIDVCIVYTWPGDESERRHMHRRAEAFAAGSAGPKGAAHKGSRLECLGGLAKYGLFSASKNASILRRVTSRLSAPYTLSFHFAPIKHNGFSSRTHPLRSLDPSSFSDSHLPQVSCYSRKYRLLMSRRFHCHRASFLAFLQATRWGSPRFPQFGMFSLLIREKVNITSTLGTSSVTQLLAVVHRRSHLGFPLRDRHWYVVSTPQNAVIALLLM